MANARGKSIDTTDLSIDQAERRGFIHRDYIAHCLRWTHVAKYMHQKQRYKTGHVLDVGCGCDLPLAKMFYTSRLILAQYVGVDYNPAGKFDMDPFHTGKMPVDAYGSVDFAVDVEVIPNGPNLEGGFKVAGDYFKSPNVITCFEVLEHVEPEHARRMLIKMHQLLSHTKAEGREGVAFISTPCYDAQVGHAANHVSEIKRVALGGLIEDLGFKIEGNWGTFASQRDYRDDLFFEEFGDVGREIWRRLSAYYDSNYLATVLAPLYPQGARNNIWQISPLKANETYERKFAPLAEVEGPWTSSEHWAGLDGSMTDA